MSKRIFNQYFLFSLAGCSIFASAVLRFNHMMLERPVDKAVHADRRNNNMQVNAHYKHYVNLNTVVLNLDSKQGATHNEEDMDRVLGQASVALKQRNFQTVEVEYSGITTYTMNNKKFNAIGDDYTRRKESAVAAQ